MYGIFQGFITDLLNNALGEFDGALQGLFTGMLYIERMMSEVFPESAVSNTYRFIYLFGASLAILKFLKKGFSIYVLWRDGDADSSPQDMFIGMIYAAAIMIGFPSLYDMLTRVTLWFSDGIMNSFGLSRDLGLKVLSNTTADVGLFYLIVILVYFICAVVLWIQLIRRGIELLILRLGIPIACMGLLDSDGGVFKSYIQTLFQAMFTTVVQIALMSLSLRAMTVFSLPTVLFGIAALMGSFGTPVMMQKFMVASSGGMGNITNKIYSGARLAQMAKGFVGK